MYYYSPKFSRFPTLKNLYCTKKCKIFLFFIAQFNYWHYLCTAFFGRVCRKGAENASLAQLVRASDC